MNWNAAIAALGALLLAGAGCSKERAADGTATVKLEGLPGIEAHVPTGTVVSKNAVGIGVMLKGEGVSMTIGPALDVDAATLEQAKETAQTYSATDVKSELLPDGFILTYTSEGSMGVNYWLVGRRELDDGAYTCGVSSPKQAHQKSAIAICKSLTR